MEGNRFIDFYDEACSRSLHKYQNMLFYLLSLILVTVIRADQFQQCSCDGCNKNDVVGLLNDDMCYFIPVNVTFTNRSIPSFKSNFPLFQPNEKKLNTPIVTKLIQELVANAFIRAKVRFVNLPTTNTKCQTLDVLTNETSENCSAPRHAIFEDDNSDILKMTPEANFSPCQNNSYYISDLKETCIYFSEDGVCNENHQVVNISSIEKYRSIEQFIGKFLLTVQTLVLFISMPSSTINSIPDRKYVYIENGMEMESKDRSCSLFFQNKKQIVKRNGTECTRNSSTICEYVLRANFDGELNKQFPYKLYISITAASVAMLFIAVGSIIFFCRRKTTDHVNDSVLY